MALYYSGENAGRISIIVNNRTVFEQIRELMSHYKIPDEISVILVSTEKQKVLDEYVMSLSDGQEAKRVLADYQEFLIYPTSPDGVREVISELLLITMISASLMCFI